MFRRTGDFGGSIEGCDVGRAIVGIFGEASTTSQREIELGVPRDRILFG